jgi:hypothetical protein
MKKIISFTFLLSISMCIKVVFPRTIHAQIDIDTNGDGRIDGVEYTVWLVNYNQSASEGKFEGDFNRSGFVDGVDFTLWLANYGTTSSTTTPTHISTTTPTRVITNAPTATNIPTTAATGTRIPTPTPGFCYVKIAGYVYNMQPGVGIRLTDQTSSKTQTHSRGDFRCGTLANPTDVTAVYLDKHDKLGCWQRVAPYIVTPPAPVDATCP